MLERWKSSIGQDPTGIKDLGFSPSSKGRHWRILGSGVMSSDLYFQKIPIVHWGAWIRDDGFDQDGGPINGEEQRSWPYMQEVQLPDTATPFLEKPGRISLPQICLAFHQIRVHPGGLSHLWTPSVTRIRGRGGCKSLCNLDVKVYTSLETYPTFCQLVAFRVLGKKLHSHQCQTQPWGGLVKSTCWNNEDFIKRVHGNVLDRRLSLTAQWAQDVIHSWALVFHPGGRQRPSAHSS